MPDTPIKPSPLGPVPGGAQPGPPGEGEQRFPVLPTNRPPRLPYEPGLLRPFSEPAGPGVLARPERKRPGALETLRESFTLDSPMHAASRMLELSGLPVDPDFLFTEEVQRSLLDDVPPELREPLREELAENAFSMDHARLIKENFREDMRRESMIAEAGGGGLALRVLANVADPVGIALSAATGGLGWVTKGARLANSIRLGALTAAEATALEAFVADTQVTRDTTDVVTSALAGFALGGAIGGVLTPAATRGGLPQDVPGAPAGQSMQEAINAATRRTNADSIVEALDAAGLDSAGAARAQVVQEPLVESEVLGRFNVRIDEEVERGAFSNVMIGKLPIVRWDLVGRLGGSDDPAIRDAARAHAQEGVGLAEHGVLRVGASERADLIHNGTLVPWRRGTNPEYSNWLQERQLGPMDRHSFARRDEFYSEVGEAVVREGSSSAAVRKAARSTSDFFERYLRAGKAARVSGLEDVPINRSYLPRVAKNAAVREMAATHGDNQMNALFAQSFLDANPDLDEPTARLLGQAMFRGMRQRAEGLDFGMLHGINTDDVDTLKTLLRTGAPDLDDADIDATVLRIQTATEGASRVSRAKRRADVDMNTELRMADGTKVRMTQLYEMNAERLAFSYSRIMSGHIAFAREVNVRSPGDHRDLMNALRSRGVERGRDPGVVDGEIKALEHMYKGVTGHSLEGDPTTLFARAGRAALRFNFLRIGAAFGIAQLSEIGQALGASGFRNMMVQMPALRGLVASGRDGQIALKLGRDLEGMVAPGVERLINQAAVHFESHGVGIADRGVLRKIDEASVVGARFLADVSGLSGSVIVFQRMGTAGVAQKLMGFALGRRLTKTQAERLRGMGLSEEMQERVFAQMREHTSRERSELAPGKYRLLALNPENWTDQEALDALTIALYREGRRIVQRNDIGTRAIWFDTVLGQLITQFRGFMLSSWTKATLHGLHHRDFQAYAAFQTSMFIGALGYIAQQSINVSDPEDRAERLSPIEIAKAGFLRTAHASLAPMLVDSTAQALFRTDPMFSYGRASGLTAEAFMGVPAVDLAAKLVDLAGVPGSALRTDQQITQRDLRNLKGVLPVLGGFLGINRVIEAVGEDLPRERNE